MAKTPLSLTADPSIKGAPTGFTIPVKDMYISVGAEFIIPMTGDVSITKLFSILMKLKTSLYSFVWHRPLLSTVYATP